MKTNFTKWLAEKMGDANLSQDEIQEFVDWMAKREAHDKKKDAKETKADISLHDVGELFVWLKGRLHSSNVDKRNQHELLDWLVKKLKSEGGNLDERDLSNLKKDLLDDH